MVKRGIRARQIHEKEGRRQEILAAGLRCLAEERFGALTMAQVAREAGVAKGTLYLYFRTKEALFLALTEDMLLTWFEALDEALGASREVLGAEGLAGLITRSLEDLPQLPRLLGILHTVLEQNVDYLTALRFKEFLATRVQRTGRHLEHRLPFLGEGQGSGLFLKIYALVLGFWQMGDPASVVEEVLEAPGLQVFRIEFFETLFQTIQDLVHGLQASDRREGAWR